LIESEPGLNRARADKKQLIRQKATMIKVSIFAGCTCSVWKVGGGLQPGLVSLPLPPEVMAKLEAWKKTYDSTCWSPLFSRRKAHDAEGRIIAAELQKAVGDKDIQIIFRHWVEFDPKQWRSFWREENLCTGERQEFWLPEDLPNGIELKVVRIFPDDGGAYLWDLEGSCIGNGSLSFPDELDERFEAWSESWAACFDFATREIDRARLAEEHFDERGIALAAELKASMGQAARVIYYCTLREAAVEILEDGKTIECARETDFRQWALDQAR
jgi:hypothetical protein